VGAQNTNPVVALCFFVLFEIYSTGNVLGKFFRAQNQVAREETKPTPPESPQSEVRSPLTRHLKLERVNRVRSARTVQCTHCSQKEDAWISRAVTVHPQSTVLGAWSTVKVSRSKGQNPLLFTRGSLFIRPVRFSPNPVGFRKIRFTQSGPVQSGPVQCRFIPGSECQNRFSFRFTTVQSGSRPVRSGSRTISTFRIQPRALFSEIRTRS
jgi:hypothetical protein